MDLRSDLGGRRHHAGQLGIPDGIRDQGPGDDAQLVAAGDPRGFDGAGLVLADTTQFLTAVTIDSSGSPCTVTAQTGVTMDVLLQDLENAGLGLTAHPAPGDITIGGVLAIDGHGTAIPAEGETIIPGTHLRLGQQSDPVSHGGRVELGSEPVRPSDLRALGSCNPAPAGPPREDLRDGGHPPGWRQHPPAVPELHRCPGQRAVRSTRVEFADVRLLRAAVRSGGDDLVPVHVCPVAEGVDDRSSEATAVSRGDAPYNYVFADVIPKTLSVLIKEILDGDVAVTPTFGQAELDIVTAGLLGTLTADIWGWAKDLLLYVKPSTLRVTANGYAVLTSRASIQQVIYDFTTYYESQVAAYQAQGDYPMNGPVEIRVTGLDGPGDVEIASATRPSCRRCDPDRINRTGT